MVRLDVNKDENLRDCSVLAIRPRENEHKNETPKTKVAGHKHCWCTRVQIV